MPNIISQLVSAFTRTGADPADNVRSPFTVPARIMSAFDRSGRPIQSTTVRSSRPANAMPHQTDNAQPPAADLPPYAFAFPTPASPKRQSDTAIDLTSPAGSPQKSREGQHAPDNQRPGPTTKRRVSDDEKRLTGDFQYSKSLKSAPCPGLRLTKSSVPADRVVAPDPGSYFRAPRSAMGKPGSQSAFQPGLNTLDGTPSKVKHVTYGKKPRTHALVSEASSPGQAAFDDLHKKALSTPARNTSLRQNSAIQSVKASPTKRRKIETSTASPIIDLSDDDEVQEVANPDQPVSPALARAPGNAQRSLPSVSAPSRQSAGSRPTFGGPLPSLDPTNEFLRTENFIKPGRKTGKKGLQQDLTRVSSRQTASGSVTPQMQTTPVVLQEDDDMIAARTLRLSNPRRAILKECKQGAQDSHFASPESKEVRSRHFENARVNESTSNRQRLITTATQSNGTSGGLRSFQRAAYTKDSDLYSDDELGQDLLKTTMAAPLKSGTPSKSARTANSGARRKSKAQEAAQGWPLKYARTHDFDSRTAFLSETPEHPLILRHGKDLNTLEISLWMDKSGDFTVLATINTRNVIKCQADDVGHIRLEGSRTSDGILLIVDLEFNDVAAFREFRDQHASSYCGRKVYLKEEKTMEVLFSKPSPKRDSTKRSTLVQDSLYTGTATRSSQAQAGGSPLWEGMKTGTQRTQHTLPAPSNRGLAESSNANAQVRASTRPTRTPRATAPTHDTYEPEPNHELERFSVVHGLGTPWVKELTFGEGRQRAQVIFDDLMRLDEEEFLNDNLINFYMTYLFKQSKVSPNKVHFFNTFFYNRLRQNTGREYINYEAVKRWTRDDIFTHDYIVVPINEQVHWYLAIICNVRNIARKAIEEDFDEAAPKKISNEIEALARNGDALATEPRLDPHAAEASDAPDTCADSTTVCPDDEANLFDEESKLNLIDPDAVHPDAIQTTETQSEVINVSLPRVTSPQQGAIRATPSIFDPQPTSKTVLSNLHASPEKRKLKKRRSMAPKRDPTQPVVVILDSLSQTRTHAVRALKDWIAAEGEAKRGMEANIKERGLYPKGDQIPTQSNFSDCGVYLLGYAEKFFEDPDDFTRKLLTGEMTLDVDWPQLKPKEMRNNLRDIIVAIAEEQELAVPIKKKKKGKKTAMAVESSPVKADTEAAEPGPLSPVLKQPLTEAEKSCAVPPQSTSTLKDPDPSMAQGDPTAVKPRLASPFIFKKTEKVLSPGKASSRAIRSASPTKTEPESPHQDQIHGRRTHPEVRIPRKASPAKEGREKVQVAPGEPSLPKGSKDRLASTLKRTMHPMNDVEHKNPPTKSTPRLETMDRKHNTKKSPGGRHTDGHSDHPIEIPDSQEASHASLRSPPRAKVRSSTTHKQRAKSPRQAHALQHEPSVEEISGFPPQVAKSQSRQVEDDFVGSQLVAELDADDAQRAESAAIASVEGLATQSLQRRRSEPDLDAMDVDAQGNDPMDMAEDNTDEVVHETPEAARRSPSILAV